MPDPPERAGRIAFPAALPATRRGQHWELEAAGRSLRLSHLDKVYWPDDGITKGDLLTYYFNVAGLVLPHLRDRPLTLRRMPDGLAGQPFYEKRVPPHAPDWLPRAEVPTSGEPQVRGRTTDARKLVPFVVAQDLASLLYVVNLGCIELHPLHARAGSLDRPDYAFFDLDPFPPYTFGDVLTVARLVKVVLDGLGLRAYPKTSGATGMQVFVPLDGRHTFAETRAFVERVGRMIVQAYPEKATMAWKIADRAGKVFVDHAMNREGANIASVYSVRPEPRAPVSTPLHWDELDEDLEPQDFRIDNVWQRFAQGDRFAGVLHDRQSLEAAMDTLGLPREPRRPVPPPPPIGRLPSGSKPRTRQPVAPPTPRSTSEPAGPDATPPPVERLDAYTGKRDFRRTPEPSGVPSDEPRAGTEEGQQPETDAGGLARPAGVAVAPVLEPGRRYTIQQHHARRLHHDVRFETGGVLRSFAVPKRLPEVPGVRHLAVNTEDHPLEYLTFSGEIPQGEYGGGTVRLFDLGTYELLEERHGTDPESKFSVRLHGARYQGAEYHFVRTRDRDWICFLAGTTPLPRPQPPPALQPMLATAAAEPFDDPGWLFEVKWDGHRCLAALDDLQGTRLASRTGRDATDRFPELAELHQQLVARNALVDGEVAALDAQGRPSFARMQDRFHRSAAELARRRDLAPVQFLAFDLLWLDGAPLTGQPLAARRALLEEVLVPSPLAQISQAIPAAGIATFERVRELGLEGVVGKRAASTYQPGRRSPDWRKVKAHQRQDCVIVGWTPGKGARSTTLGSLLLAVRAGDAWQYAGNVGTGFTGRLLAALLEELVARERPEPPPVAGLPRARGTRWVTPELVCEVEHQGWTREGRLRGPSFKGIRSDKPADEAVRESPT